MSKYRFPLPFNSVFDVLVRLPSNIFFVPPFYIAFSRWRAPRARLVYAIQGFEPSARTICMAFQAHVGIVTNCVQDLLWFAVCWFSVCLRCGMLYEIFELCMILFELVLALVSLLSVFLRNKIKSVDSAHRL